MNVLVVGGGAREHALVWKLKQSPKVEQLYIAPGNAGTAILGENIPISATDEIIEWLAGNKVGLVVVGPDKYLAEGLVDKVRGLGIPVFGPSRAAAEIEWSKSYAKDLMKEAGIPTAAYETFTSADTARAYVRTQSLPIVIKADGLAEGKGVIIAETLEEADTAITDILEGKKFGVSGSSVVIEEYLEGLEISVHAFCDGKDFRLFPTSKDHKRIFEGNKGPNTGGMGTIAPVPDVTPQQVEEISERIIRPLLKALEERGRPFAGLLFPGIMLTAEGPKVIEFNARFGDPETEVYMRLLKSDLFDILYACATGTLKDVSVEWSAGFACCVMLASSGYPGKYEKGIEIQGLPAETSEVVVFHAGTALKDGALVTSGGRVLGVTALGSTLEEARGKAYKAIEEIHFDGMQYRKDIGE